MRRARPVIMVLVLAGLSVASCRPAESEGTTVADADHPTTTAVSIAYPSPSATVSGPEAGSVAPAEIDTSVLVQVPDPLSEENPQYLEEALALPAVGAAFEDGSLGTSIARVTEQPGIRHEYSRFDPFNADRSMILLSEVSEGGFAVSRAIPPYDGPENRVRELDLEEPRWDRSDSNLITGFAGFRIVTVDVATGGEATVKDFAADSTIGPLIASNGDLYRVTTREEGEASWDGRWWALALQGTAEDYRLRYLFCWDRSVDQVVGLYELEPDQADIDWVGMSALGDWVLIGAEPDNGDPLAGFTIADRELTEFHRINYETSHADVGLDVNGREVVVMQNSSTDHVDLLSLAASTKPVTESGEGYRDSGHVPLVRLFYDSGSPIGFDGGIHISCNAPRYAVVSTHQEPGRQERNWLDRSIILVKLDPEASEAYYVAKIHNATEEYWEETHATISNDGRTVVWAANFGIDVGEEKGFLLRVDLPQAP